MKTSIKTPIKIALLLTLTTLSKVSAADLPWSDGDFSCIPQDTAQKYISDFNINIESFGGLEICDSKKDSKKLFDDLQIIENGAFSSQGSNLLIRGYIPAGQYYSWMKSQTRGMDRGNDVPYATAYNSGGYFTMQNGWSLSSTLGRVGTVIHEARHTAGYMHTRCTRGPYAETSVSGCDRDYAQSGSHSVEMEYYARVAVLGQNFHPVYKAMARLMAMGRSNFVFNKSPIQTREGLLTINQIGQAEILDSGQFHTRETNGAHGNLKRTSFGASLFNGVQSFAIEMYEFFKTDLPVSDDYSYYKLLKEDRGQGADKLADFEELDLGIKRYAVYLNQKNQVGRYIFSEGKFSSAKSLPQQAQRFLTATPKGETGLFVLAANQGIYKLDPETMNLTATNQMMPDQIEQLSLYQGKVLALNQNGKVLIPSSDQAQGAWQEDSRFAGKSIQQMVAVPLYDAFDVK